MEEQPSKRRGRPRKVMDVPEPIEEGEDASAIDAGIGETRTDRIEPSPDDVRQGESWLQFLDRVNACKNKKLRHVFHPNPQHNLIHRESGNLNVFVGPIKGQLSTGEFIDL